MNSRFQRQELAFGKLGQERLQMQRVGIVGLGGLGCIAAQSLVALGVKRFVLVDADVLSESNLNRWVLGFASDVGRTKVELVERYIRAVDPTAEVDSHPSDIRNAEALKALMACSTIFGCVDNDGARLILTELCAAYEIPLIDSASEIFPAGRGEFDFGGRVVVARPGDFCLVCARELDLEEAKAALESDAVRQAREAHGYGLGHSEPSPSVVSLNGTIANLAVTEFVAMTTKLRAPARKLLYRGMRGTVSSSLDAATPDCYTCAYLRGQREAANVLRYALEESHSSCSMN